jgi:hypothetical protein
MKTKLTSIRDNIIKIDTSKIGASLPKIKSTTNQTSK